MILPVHDSVRAHVARLLTTIYALDEASLPTVALEYPPNRELGDLGTPVAFELARRLRAEGAPAPTHLFVSGHRAPQLPNPRSPLAHLPDAEFLDELRTRYDGVPAEVLRHPDLMALLLPCLRADLALVEDYRCRTEEPLACPIAAYGGEDDPVANEAELAAWQLQTCGVFTLTRFAGTHFFIRSAREELLAALARELTSVPETIVGGSVHR